MLHKVFQTLVFFCLLISAIKGIDTRRVAKPTFRAEEDEDYDDEDSDDTKGGVFLGSFDSYAHQLSGEVTLLDDKTMEISNLNYDGTGPAAWFMLGKTSRSTLPEFIDLDGTIIPDENEALVLCSKELQNLNYYCLVEKLISLDARRLAGTMMTMSFSSSLEK